MALRRPVLPSSGAADGLPAGRERGEPIERPQGYRAAPAEESNVEVAIQFLRAGTLLIVGFQGLFFAMHAWLLGARFTRYLFVFHLLSIACGGVGFLISYSGLARRHWRPIAFCVS